MGSHESTNNHGDFDVVPEHTSTKHVHFSPEKSRISEAALEEWKEAPLNGDLTQIPGVGKVSAAALQRQGIPTSYALIGHFLSLVDENGLLPACDRFKALLEDCETPAAYRDTVVLAIGEKLNAGFRVEGMDMPAEIVESTQCNHQDIEDFLAKELTGDPQQDFKGVGPKSKSALAEQGVDTTWQMLGTLLTLGDALEFREQLKLAGVASGWRSTIAHQCVEKVAAGVKLPTQ